MIESIDRPMTRILRLWFTAASTICWILDTLLENVEIINLPGALVNTSLIESITGHR